MESVTIDVVAEDNQEKCLEKFETVRAFCMQCISSIIYIWTSKWVWWKTRICGYADIRFMRQ